MSEDKYGTLAINATRYDAKVLVNKGNCALFKMRAMTCAGECKKGDIAREKNELDDAMEQYAQAKDLYTVEGVWGGD
jgi:hypothetical protein